MLNLLELNYNDVMPRRKDSGKLGRFDGRRTVRCRRCSKRLGFIALDDEGSLAWRDLVGTQGVDSRHTGQRVFPASGFRVDRKGPGELWFSIKCVQCEHDGQVSGQDLARLVSAVDPGSSVAV